MECVILVLGTWAWIKEFKWTAGDPKVADRLNREIDEVEITPVDPQPMIKIAEYVVRKYRGEVVWSKELEPEPGAVY